MPAITAPNVTLLRQPYHAIDNPKLNLFRKEVKATALINQASFDYPILSLTVDNTSADWLLVREGEYFEITNGSGTVILRGVHRRNTAATTMYVGRMVDGQDWFSREIAESLADNMTVTSYTVQIPAAFVSRIDETDPTIFYKRADREFDTVNPQTAYPKPQPNMGGGQQADVVSTVATFEEDASNSITWIGSPEYEWDVGSGSITVGTSTDPAITWTTTAGQYYVELNVVDDGIPGGQDSKRGFRLRFANGATYKAFSDEYQVDISPVQVGMDGASFQITVYGQDAIDELFTGMPALLSFDIITSADGLTWDELEDGQGRIYIEGYIKAFSRVYSDQRGVKYVVADIVSPMQYAEALPFADQSLKSVAGTPANWQETTESLMHAGFWQYYSGEYHAPSLLYLHDFYADEVTGFARPTVSMSGGNVKTAWQSTAALYTGYVTCTRDGSFHCKRDPVMEDDTFRDAIDEVWNWTGDDKEDDTYNNPNSPPGLEYALAPFLKVGDMSSAATVTSPSTFTGHEARYGLFAQGQSPNHGDLPDFIGLDEDDIYERVGHAYQRENTQFEVFTINAKANRVLVAEPALLEWHTLDLASYDPFSIPLLDGGRVLPVSARYTIDAENARLFGAITVRPETKGKPADEIIREQAQGGGVVPSDNWQHTLNFVLSDEDGSLETLPNREGGFAAFGSTPRGSWVDGQGWTTEEYSLSGVKHMCEVVFTLPAPAFVTSLELDFENTSAAGSGGGTSFGIYVHGYSGGTGGTVYAGSRYGPGFGASPAVNTINATIDTVAAALYFQLTSTADIWTPRLRIYGTGVNPFV